MNEEQPQPEEAVVEGDAEERMNELAEATTEELANQLDLSGGEPGDDAALQDRIRLGIVTETDMINLARTELYKKLPTLTVRDLATIYVTGLRLEEARLKVKLKQRDDDTAGGMKDLRQKAAKAMAGRGD